MTLFRWTAAVTVLGAGALAVPVLFSGLSPALVLRTLLGLGEPVLAAWMVWVLVAPLLLLGAGVCVRRSPWPWTILVTVHLCSLLVATLRFGHWAPLLSRGSLLMAVACGVASVVAAVGTRRRSATTSAPDSVR